MTTAVSNHYESLGLAQASQRVKKTEIGQDDFLKLMTTQLQAQDPFKPMDSSQFLGQIAQFSQVSGLQSLNTAFADLAGSLNANQTLQGASLVGREVLVPGETLSLDGSGEVGGAVDLPRSGWLSLEISDASGQLVRRIDAGDQPAGLGEFRWDGLDSAGQRLPAGQYQLRASLAGSDGSALAASTFVAGTVRAVQPGATGLQLQVTGLGSVALADVTRIQ